MGVNYFIANVPLKNAAIKITAVITLPVRIFRCMVEFLLISF